jgi:hypothetical protein
MPGRHSDPPAPSGDRPKRSTDTGRFKKRLSPGQYELKIRWDKARQVLDVSATGVQFDFDSPLKVGMKYPVTLTAPGVSLASTIEVTRCQLTVLPESGRFFRVTGKFFPYVE